MPGLMKESCGEDESFVSNSHWEGTSMIKCAHECNYCRMRNVMINDCTVETHCLRRKQIETLDRVIKCQETINLRIEFAKDLVLVLVTSK